MKSLIVVVLFAALALADYAEEEGVLVLDRKTFHEALKEFDYVLVEFYAPWCGHCKALTPEYAKAADEMKKKEGSVRLAKVDATQENDLAQQHGVKGYPTLKLFKHGLPAFEYSGARSAEAIVNWLTRKTGAPALTLTGLDESRKFIEGHDVAIVGFFKDPESEKAKAYLSVAGLVDDQAFGITADESLFGEHGAEDGHIILFKKFDDGKVVYEGELNEIDLKRFVTYRSLPLLVEFNQETAQKVFGGEIKSHLLFFIGKSSAEYEATLNAARDAAKLFLEKVLFVTIDTDEEEHGRILEFFGLKKEEVPAIRLIRLEEDMAKYKPQTDAINTENIKAFVQSFLDGELRQHLLSQDLPEDWDKAPVKTLVAHNFNEVVNESGKNVLVEFYAPWCGHCKQLAPIFDKVGEHFEGNDDVIIAKMDATVNELEDTRILNYPTIKLFTRDNQVYEYNGPRTFEGLTKFVESGGQEGMVPQPKEEETEDDDTPRKDEL